MIAWLCLTRRGVGVVALLAVLVAYGNGVFMLHHLVPDHAGERSLKLYADRLSQLEQPDADVVFYGWIRYSILYYYGDDITYFDPDELDWKNESAVNRCAGLCIGCGAKLEFDGGCSVCRLCGYSKCG